MFTSILIITILAGNVSLQKKCSDEKKNIVIWDKTKKISWEDFKGAKPYNLKSDAEISVQLSLEYLVNERLENYDVICYMIKDKSWSEDTSAYGLQHEQTHFDIGEIFARKLRKAILSYKKPINRQTVGKLDSMYYYYRALLDEEQDLYDRETSHSRDIHEQKKWNTVVAKKLDSLKAFKRIEMDMGWKRKIKK